MNNTMFCYQCQETMGNSGCRLRGVCGKLPETAARMDALIRQLKLLSASREPSRELGRFVCKALFMTLTNTNFDDTRLDKALRLAEQLTGETSVNAPLGVLACEDEDIRSLRELLTYGLKGIAAYTEHAAVLEHYDDEIYDFLFKALGAMAHGNMESELLALIQECGNVAVKAMALLDEANTEHYGHPEITKVSIGVGSRPGILISGHDLKDLEELLEQSRGTGIDIYTHGEMLAANSYPFFKKYPHLRGNYGNAWHRQNTEFAAFNGPILMTTNCITPVQESYRDRIFTTGVAGYPGVRHISEDAQGKKNFAPLIELAKKCPPPTPIDNGTLTTGFAHNQVIALADKITEAVKSGAIRRFIVMAGCDGRHVSRNYYTTLAEKLPKDTVILTAGCAKYRYNKLLLGEIGGIPRVLDAGQCNDCYSLVLIAKKLQEAFGLKDPNQLPLSFDIAWYEQKAVAVLLALLALGFKNIRLGPTLPGFLSPKVAKLLIDTYQMKGITTPEEDIADMLKG